MRHAYSILVIIPEGKRPLVRPGIRWENDIKMDLKEVERGGLIRRRGERKEEQER
jgi:hypothetical protein